jgi:hypothetical protein
MLVRILVPLLVLGFVHPAMAEETKTQNIILITLDGVRTQEVFSGAEKALLSKDFGGVRDVAGLVKRFWRESPEERREALLPFLWGTIAKQGQVFGDREKGSPVNITNRQYFSYPGYNEILAGFGDPAIESNDKLYNKNTTVLEFLHGKDRFKGKVEAYTCWDVFPFIINDKRSGIPVNAGQVPPFRDAKTQRQELVNAMAAQMPPVWSGVCFDVFAHEPGLDAIKEQRVSILYIAYGETDDWAHDKRYDCYLDAAHRCDGYIKELWETCQSLPKYKDKTTLIVTTDHGRGDNPANWTGHGNKARTSEFGWIAVLGPDTPASGVREKSPVTQSQVAATVAKLLGEDFAKSDERIGKPLDVTK